MNIFAEFSLIPQFTVGLDALGKFARAIIEGVGIIGLGIIVFTLVLKAMTLPFDIYQRYQSRKQTLIMRNMKDDLDKLQKQYANDKATYNMKMSELYKKNGYSMFGACLPMIISLVILIVAFQGFNSYSRYANAQLFKEMSESYNAVILENAADGLDYTVTEEEGVFTIGHPDDETAHPVDLLQQETVQWTKDGVSYEVEYREATISVVDENNQTVTEGDQVVTRTVSAPYLKVTSEKAEHFLLYSYSLGGYSAVQTGGEISVTFIPAETVARGYLIDADKLYAYVSALPEEEEKDGETVTTAAGAAKHAIDAAKNDDGTYIEEKVRKACTDYLVDVGATAASEYYWDNRPSFLWIKNVWESDATYRHPVPSSTVSSSLDQNQYDNLTSKLAAQKSSPNGYYVLIILSIVTMGLSQFIMMRSQKESNKYQTVDGQGAMTQKVMLFVMPLLYAVFAFLYSAAFSIYMIISSVIALLVTILCNLVLNHIFKKKEEAAIKAQYGRKLKWMEQKDGKKRK